jgi:hypothetical protein
MDPKLRMEVPPQVRELAEKSVDQAEKAMSSFCSIGQPVCRNVAGAHD